MEWDYMLRTPKGETWPTMVGRLNAALNQSGTLDRSIDDVLEHFVYVPKQSPANPQDIPFFLSTRLAPPESDKEKISSLLQDEDELGDAPNEEKQKQDGSCQDYYQILMKYERRAAQIAHEYEENMVRF